MNKKNNRSAAGLRRSAVAERMRLREEWSALKGTDVQPVDNFKKKQNAILKEHRISEKSTNSDGYRNHRANAKVGMDNPRFAKAFAATGEVLRGVVALVEVGAESRALALRAALTALGATVMPAWSPLVTHLVWAQGGCRSTRCKARALACRLVSPLWVEACAASGEHLMESKFPAAPRPSDLPSPKTLRHLLKRAEMENVSIVNVLTDSKEDDAALPRLRISSENERDESADASDECSGDESRDTITDRSRPNPSDKTRDKSANRMDGVNNAPSVAAPPRAAAAAAKSKRKLFTNREAHFSKSTSDETDAERTSARTPVMRLVRRGPKRAERAARRLVRARPTEPARRGRGDLAGRRYSVVLTGMSRSERVAVHDAIRTLNGHVQNHINKRTTHVLLGSCRKDWAGDKEMDTSRKDTPYHIERSAIDTSNVAPVVEMAGNAAALNRMAGVDEMARGVSKARTVKALLGAVRGCRVLRAAWAADSAAAGRWLHHYGYEVPHLRKISQRARVERQALELTHCEYAYDVFHGMRVSVAPAAEYRGAAVMLLSLCGAHVEDGVMAAAQDGGLDATQDGVLDAPQYGNLAAAQDGRPAAPQDGNLAAARNGRRAAVQDGSLAVAQDGRLIGLRDRHLDIVIGVGDDEVSPKWVFDSIVAARMRTVRRYINKNAR